MFLFWCFFVSNVILNTWNYLFEDSLEIAVCIVFPVNIYFNYLKTASRKRVQINRLYNRFVEESYWMGDESMAEKRKHCFAEERKIHFTESF